MSIVDFRGIVWVLLFGFSSLHQAWGAPSIPISRSFESLKKCYPILANDEFKQSVDLDRLKEKIDNFDFTVKSTLRYRRLTYIPQGGTETHRLTIRALTKKGSQYSYEMFLEKMGPTDGVPTELEIPLKQRKNPKQADINTYIFDADLKLEETSYVDTKLNGHTLIYSRQFKKVYDLVLKDSKGVHTLTCENQKNLGVVCTCK
jgi:hypothetical protein